MEEDYFAESTDDTLVETANQSEKMQRTPPTKAKSGIPFIAEKKIDLEEFQRYLSSQSNADTSDTEESTGISSQEDNEEFEDPTIDPKEAKALLRANQERKRRD